MKKVSISASNRISFCRYDGYAFILQHKANLDFKLLVSQQKVHMNAYVSPRKEVMKLSSVLDKGERMCKVRQEKRHKLQLFYTIICAIDEETIITGSARPTRIQHHSRLSYDRMINHLAELEEKRMIYRSAIGFLSITNKGKEFIKQYERLINLIEDSDN
jgi:predicted transcriptional regulator